MMAIPARSGYHEAKPARQRYLPSHEPAREPTTDSTGENRAEEPEDSSEYPPYTY